MGLDRNPIIPRKFLWTVYPIKTTSNRRLQKNLKPQNTLVRISPDPPNINGSNSNVRADFFGRCGAILIVVPGLECADNKDPGRRPMYRALQINKDDAGYRTELKDLDDSALPEAM